MTVQADVVVQIGCYSSWLCNEMSESIHGPMRSIISHAPTALMSVTRYMSSLRLASRLVVLTRFLLLSVIRARVFGWLRTPATTAPIKKEAAAKAKLLLDSPFIS